jgi:flavin reductase (DIM6/NTAB) family NADH-FMN oxidoreductase RutF
MTTANELDKVVATMDSAMVVVTVAVEDERDGCLVGFHSQVSIEPRRYAVWLSRANRTTALAQRADHLAVHVLGRHQHELAELFGGEQGDRVDKLVHTTWEGGPGGVPLLVACPVWFAGRITARQDIDGDHLGVVLDPLDAGWETSWTPLRLGDAHDIEPGHPA